MKNTSRNISRRHFIQGLSLLSAGITLMPQTIFGESRQPIKHAIPSSGQTLAPEGVLRHADHRGTADRQARHRDADQRRRKLAAGQQKAFAATPHQATGVVSDRQQNAQVTGDDQQGNVRGIHGRRPDRDPAIWRIRGG